MLNKNIEENNKFIIGNYSRYPISIIRGEGSYVYDSNNKKYYEKNNDFTIDYGDKISIKGSAFDATNFPR